MALPPSSVHPTSNAALGTGLRWHLATAMLRGIVDQAGGTSCKLPPLVIPAKAGIRSRLDMNERCAAGTAAWSNRLWPPPPQSDASNSNAALGYRPAPVRRNGDAGESVSSAAAPARRAGRPVCSCSALLRLVHDDVAPVPGAKQALLAGRRTEMTPPPPSLCVGNIYTGINRADTHIS